jgi:hypothetical protein
MATFTSFEGIIMSDRLDMTEPDDGAQETAEEISIREGIYGEIKRALIARGIPAAEIAFIHDFPTPARKAQAFADCNAGRIRVMLASTEKAGTGVNMQERLYALHHLDVPWRPSDVEQREGRILRQGNVHKEVHICQYVTEGSFDAYMWQTLESKARFISQIMAGEVTARTAEDVDQLVMTAAQIKAIASGNPQILEKVGLEVELTRLERLYSVWSANRRRMRRQLETLPPDIELVAKTVAGHERAIAARDRCTADHAAGDFQITLRKSHAADAVVTFTDRQRAGAHLRQIGFAVARESGQSYRYSAVVGSYRGFEIVVRVSGTPADLLSSLFSQTEMSLRLSANDAVYSFNVGESDAGIIQSMDAQLRGLETRLEQARATQRELQHRYEQINAELNKGWEHAAGYQEMKARLDLVNASLSGAGCEIEPSPELSNLEADALMPVPAVNVRQLVSIAAEDTPATVDEPVVADTTDSAVSIDLPKSARADQVEGSELQPVSMTSESVADLNQGERNDDWVFITPFINQPQPAVAQKHKTAKRRAALSSLVSDESEQLSFNWT